MAKARDERHRYGQHYTPREVARLLAAFAICSPHDVVLDPSCGDGRLLEEALKRKRQLTARNRSTDLVLSDQVFGVDRSASAVQVAARTGACVAAADFFDVEPGASLNSSMSLPLEFDALIGNPPYIRHEVIGSRDKGRIEDRLARDRGALPGVFWPRWSGRSDIYVYFFAHAIRFLRPGGRLVFLTASSWLDAGYGAALREFMSRNFRVIAVIESAAESFFVDASINTCITVLEREPDRRTREENQVRFVRIEKPLSDILGVGSLAGEERAAGARTCDLAGAFVRSIECGSGSEATDGFRVRSVRQGELMGPCMGGPLWPPLADGSEERQRRGGHGGPPVQAFDLGWGKYLRADEVFFRVMERGSSRLQSLSNLASVRFGVKTGANDFFYVTDASKEGEGAKVERAEAPAQPGLLALQEVASVRRGLTTGANEFFYLKRDVRPVTDRRSPTPPEDSHPISKCIESLFLSPVVFSLREIPGILLEQAETRRMLFNCSLARSELEGTGALEYIESGERAGYSERPTCASREPWYWAARGMKPAPLIFPSKVGERWLVALNKAGVFEDKKLYGVFPAPGVSFTVLAALLNSTWARYYAEVTCRQMTGAQAIADIDVAVAEQIMLPDPRGLSSAMEKKIEGALAELARRPVYSIFEEVKREDRRRLDELTLEAIGFVERSEREAVRERLYRAVTELVRARLLKSRDQ